MHIVLWGTYDTGKPRVRILIQGLRSNGVIVTECHASIWQDVEDKSQITGFSNKVTLLFRWLLSYPVLIYRYLRLPKHDCVIVSYMGHLDVLILWPFAKLRGIPIIWDAFLSLYNTVVQDRSMLSRINPAALLLYAWEWLACRAAKKVILDTQKHADYFIDQYSLNKDNVYSVFVGAEPDYFFPIPSDNSDKSKRDISVLFYGQFIPLHGIDVIINAAKILRGQNIKWILIGQGQEAAKIRCMISQTPDLNLEWIPWVPYSELNKAINNADICLGIFGATVKARMVIPNKVFQIIATGKPLITMASPAMRELVNCECNMIRLVPENDSDTLARAVLELSSELERDQPDPCRLEIIQRISPISIGSELLKVIADK
jgi:glycosyltransferase involved in cell wall biosynthesis